MPKRSAGHVNCTQMTGRKRFKVEMAEEVQEGREIGEKKGTKGIHLKKRRPQWKKND